MAHFTISMRNGNGASDEWITSEDVLVSEAQAGQEWAFVELCSRNSRRLFSTLYRITKNREDAEDALQDALVKAYTHLGTFNRCSRFGTWLTRIGVNCALMTLRRKRTRPEVSIDAPLDGHGETFYWEAQDQRRTPEEQYVEGENAARLQRAVARLPRKYRHIYEIHQRSECTMREAAEAAGISVSAAKTRMLRAKIALRKALG
jgi:RNA polymerase sigma factor (sigma-70 family)